MAEIKKLLDDAIETEIIYLNSLSDVDNKSEVIKNLAVLHKLRIDEIKTEMETDERHERRFLDKEINDARMGIAVLELVLPLIFYNIWMKRGLRFEETGTFTSQTFKNLFNRFKPTRRS